MTSRKPDPLHQVSTADPSSTGTPSPDEADALPQDGTTHQERQDAERARRAEEEALRNRVEVYLRGPTAYTA